MLKKYTAILLMTVAYAILLGHNVIPHHHHDHHDHDVPEHNHHDQHHGDDTNREDLNHLFSHFTHSADGFNFTTSHNISNIFSKQQLSVVAVLPDNFLISKFIIPPLLYKPPAELLIYISPHSLSLGLRGPPAFIS